MVSIYTDGATSFNGSDLSFGGWAFIVIKDNELLTRAAGRLNLTTNNICELTAVINACEYASHAITEPVTIYTDSAYIVNCYKDKWYEKWINNGWKNSKSQPVANQCLWEQLIPYFRNKNFSFEKVKGHSNNEYNKLVDALAVSAKFGVNN